METHYGFSQVLLMFFLLIFILNDVKFAQNHPGFPTKHLITSRQLNNNGDHGSTSMVLTSMIYI